MGARTDLYNGVNKLKISATRFADMGYTNSNPAGKALWRFVDLTDGRLATVGPQYATKDELLSDLESYAASWGY